MPAGRIAYVNGRYLAHEEAGVHIEDRGLQLGDAIYEVVAVNANRFVDEEEHLDRLERSLREVEIAMPMARAAMKFVFREVVRRNALRNGFLYLQITRGAFRRDHPIPSQHQRPTLILTALHVNRAQQNARDEKGIAVVTKPDLRWGRCDIKTVQLLPNLLAKQAAKAAGAFEAWLVDRDGYVTEGASTNAWIVDQDGTVVTRDLSNAILPGVTRRIMLEAMAEGQVKVAERKFTLTDALNAREAFISSATGAAVPVVSIDGKVIGNGAPGPLTQRIYALYAARAGIK
ncbi:MAG: D-amino-acid transaminase [Alphaproteobacteria bacterium]|nr:D-amino-acid transaminase [Alphaproteobacteria bacterium]